MTHALASPQPPREVLDRSGYRWGMTDATSIKAHHAILGAVRKPDEQGPGWAYWKTARGGCYLQAGMVHHESDHTRTAHPRLWVWEGGKERLIELKIEKGRQPAMAVALMAGELQQVL